MSSFAPFTTMDTLNAYQVFADANINANKVVTLSKQMPSKTSVQSNFSGRVLQFFFPSNKEKIESHFLSALESRYPEVKSFSSSYKDFISKKGGLTGNVIQQVIEDASKYQGLKGTIQAHLKEAEQELTIAQDASKGTPERLAAAEKVIEYAEKVAHLAAEIAAHRIDSETDLTFARDQTSGAAKLLDQADQQKKALENKEFSSLGSSTRRKSPFPQEEGVSVDNRIHYSRGGRFSSSSLDSQAFAEKQEQLFGAPLVSSKSGEESLSGSLLLKEEPENAQNENSENNTGISEDAFSHLGSSLLSAHTEEDYDFCEEEELPESQELGEGPQVMAGEGDSTSINEEKSAIQATNPSLEFSENLLASQKKIERLEEKLSFLDQKKNALREVLRQGVTVDAGCVRVITSAYALIKEGLKESLKRPFNEVASLEVTRFLGTQQKKITELRSEALRFSHAVEDQLKSLESAQIPQEIELATAQMSSLEARIKILEGESNQLLHNYVTSLPQQKEEIYGVSVPVGGSKEMSQSSIKIASMVEMVFLAKKKTLELLLSLQSLKGNFRFQGMVWERLELLLEASPEEKKLQGEVAQAREIWQGLNEGIGQRAKAIARISEKVDHIYTGINQIAQRPQDINTSDDLVALVQNAKQCIQEIKAHEENLQQLRQEAAHLDQSSWQPLKNKVGLGYQHAKEKLLRPQKDFSPESQLALLTVFLNNRTITRLANLFQVSGFPERILQDLASSASEYAAEKIKDSNLSTIVTPLTKQELSQVGAFFIQNGSKCAEINPEYSVEFFAKIGDLLQNESGSFFRQD